MQTPTTSFMIICGPFPHINENVVDVLQTYQNQFIFSYFSRLTFSRIIKKKSTEEFSYLPYVMALSSCLLYAWYGLPIVSYKWENFLVSTINGTGMLLETSFIVIYIWFSSEERCLADLKIFPFLQQMNERYYFFAVFIKHRMQVKVAIAVILVIVVFCITASISVSAFHDHHHRKVFVGSVALVASAAMYGSPLVVVVIHLFFLF